jgi:FtsP/CotA-like multicopper oxidase with cupredoxin domain
MPQIEIPAPCQAPRGPDRRTVLAGLAASALSPSLPALAAGRVLVARPALWPLRPRQDTPVLAFDGLVPGPVLRMRQGETLPVRFENRTDYPLSLHWSGMRLANRQDGVAGLTQTAVAPGGSSEFGMTPPDPGLFIYRPAVPGKTGDLVARGLSGLVVVEENDSPPVDADIVLGISDWLLDEGGRIVSPPSSVLNSGRLGNLLTVNGRPLAAEVTVPRRSRIRLRVANMSPARLMTLRITGATAFVAAVDGHPTDVFEPLHSAFPLGPGNRIELLLAMPADPDAEVVLATRAGPGFDIVRLRTSETVSAMGDLKLAPLHPNERLPAEIRLQSALRTNFIIEGGPRQGLAEPLPWHVNGRPGTLARDGYLFTAGRGRPVVMTVANRTALPQTLHLHGHAFRVLHALDDGWDPYWLDTVTVPNGKTARIAFVADNPGRWLIASAVHDRMDQGLYGWFEVK